MRQNRDMTDPTDALLEATGERSIRSLALRLGMHQATLNRQVKGTGVPLDVLISIYRVCGTDLIDLLAALEHITPAEARQLHRSRGLEEFSDAELAEEIYNRALARAEESTPIDLDAYRDAAANEGENNVGPDDTPEGP